MTMTRLKLNVGSMNIFNAISKNIHCLRLKYGFKISNEIQYTEKTSSCRKTEIFRKIFQAWKKKLIIKLSGLHLIIK